ncbi:hypothetical protein M5K25_022090 [Dendrobium thyrsiflorum]|uniref:Uncharacterized protein n=1 Tax=Dendrobium thyrsiflorum TaxID=117978 RepID=A0ABD0U5K0_DENTH
MKLCSGDIFPAVQVCASSLVSLSSSSNSFESHLVQIPVHKFKFKLEFTSPLYTVQVQFALNPFNVQFELIVQVFMLTSPLRNFGSLPVSPPFRGKSEKLAFPSSPRERFSSTLFWTWIEEPTSLFISHMQNVVKLPENLLDHLKSCTANTFHVMFMKAPKRARETKAVEPIAKPFPMVAVVFPLELLMDLRTILYLSVYFPLFITRACLLLMLLVLFLVFLVGAMVTAPKGRQSTKKKLSIKWFVVEQMSTVKDVEGSIGVEYWEVMVVVARSSSGVRQTCFLTMHDRPCAAIVTHPSVRQTSKSESLVTTPIDQNAQSGNQEVAVGRMVLKRIKD